MEKFCAQTTSYWKRAFLLLLVIAMLLPSKAWATDVIINSDQTTQQVIAADGDTLTNNATIDFATGQTIDANNRTGVTITNNSGATINASQTSSGRSINAFAAQDLTITNSGTISSTDANAIRVSNDTNLTITNNSGGLIKAGRFSITLTGSGGSITNSGTITSTSSDTTINSGTSTGLTITNNVGGIISTSGTGTVISLSNNDSIINSGSILNNNSVGNNAIQLTGNNNTITLKEGSLIVGTIQLDAGTTGNTLKIEQGFGQAYFYETSGTGSFTIEDLSGNTAVKGSAGSVGQGANESVDELLGLRTYNLRSALKRFSAFPKQSGKNELYAEPFSFYSKRGTNSSVLGYENYGGGINFIYSLKQHNLDLILSVGRSELDLQGEHDISRNNFLAGVNATDFASLGNFKFSGFFVGGMEWHSGDREIYTNTTSTGKLDVTSDYTSYEAITGSHVSYSYSPDDKNTWKTEVGLTFGYSLIEDYEESRYFTWEERHLVQGSVHIGEQLTSKINDKLTLTVGGELEHRKVLMGREQSYAINGTTVDNKHGSFWENTAAGKLGATYLMDNNTLAYVNLDSRFSNQTRSTYGASVGIKLNF